MNIGFVSTWFERGAAYVTKSYMKVLGYNHNVFVYARGGESFGKKNPEWDYTNVTWGYSLPGVSINYSHFKKWIKKNKLNTIFFNEQNDITVVRKLKRDFPHIKVGSYIDYYKEKTVKEFYIYDFLICNTKRHYFVFKEHPQCYYIPWGTDVELFKPLNSTENKKLTFFHSAGMSLRKGTEFVINAFIQGELYKKSNLVIHTQRKISETFGYNSERLKEYNIQVIEKTVPAPGLYYLGDIYVYPTKLDGLGLTLYESLASGLPVITTNHPPMNEVINKDVGYLVEVDYFHTRQDGYYWPLSIVNQQSLIEGMRYFVDNREKVNDMKKYSRQIAVEEWAWEDRQQDVEDAFVKSDIIIRDIDSSLLLKNNKIRKTINFIRTSKIYALFYKKKRKS